MTSCCAIFPAHVTRVTATSCRRAYLLLRGRATVRSGRYGLTLPPPDATAVTVAVRKCIALYPEDITSTGTDVDLSGVPDMLAPPAPPPPDPSTTPAPPPGGPPQPSGPP